MAMLNNAQKTLVSKDLREIWNTKMVRNSMVFLPIIMVLILPVMYLVIISLAPVSEMTSSAGKVIQMLPKAVLQFNPKQQMFYIMTNMVCPMLFLMIPIMTATMSASCSFVGEKERGTIETLLLSPLTIRQIFRAKVAGCVLLSAVITAISFVVFSITIAVGNIMLHMAFFLNLRWIVLVFLLSPAFTVFGVIFMVLISGKSKSYLEAIQTSSYVVLPVIFLFIGQFMGLFQMGVVAMLLMTVLLLVLDVFLWVLAFRRFTPEKLLNI